MLKFFIYLFAAWFFFRVIRRLFTYWLLTKAPSNSFPNSKSPQKSINDLEDAEFMEIEEPKS